MFHRLSHFIIKVLHRRFRNGVTMTSQPVVDSGHVRKPPVQDDFRDGVIELFNLPSFLRSLLQSLGDYNMFVVCVFEDLFESLGDYIMFVVCAESIVMIDGLQLTLTRLMR